MDTKNAILKVNAIIISESDYKEFDKLLTLITKELGKISVYAFGVRKTNSKKIGKTRILTYGQFEIKSIKENYQLSDIINVKSFDKIALDYEAMCYVSYFIELVRYFTLENSESNDTFELLYFTLLAIENKKICYRLIRRIFELKMLKYEGIYKESKELISKNETLKFTWDTILNAKAQNLYSFTLSEEILKLLETELNLEYRDKINKKFLTLEAIN